PSPDPVRSFRVLAANSTDLQISWDPPAAASDCLVVLLQLRDLTLQSDRQFNATCSPPAEGLRLRVHPHRRYRLLATVLSDFGQSRPAMLSLRTPSARPNRSPSNFTAVGASSGAQLTWLPPPLPGRNGLLVGYRIRYRELPAESDVSATALGEDADIGDDDDESIVDGAVYKVTVPGDQLTHRLAGLKPLRRYAAQVAARTVNGTGRFTRWLVFSTLPVPTDYGLLLHGDVPLPEKIRIRPKDVTAIGKRDSILLSWTRPSALVIPDKYVIYYGSQLPKERLAGEISGDQDAYQIRNLVPNQYYFITIVAIKDGVQAETPLHEKTQSGTHDRQSPSVPLNVEGHRHGRPYSGDRDLGLPGSDAAGRLYEVELAEDATSSRSSSAVVDAKPRRFNTTGLRLRLSQLRPFTAYAARIRCCHLGYMQSDFSMVATFVTKAEPPGTPPLELRPVRLRAAHLAAAAEPNGPLTGYTVYYAPHGGQFISRNAAAKETQIVVTGLQQSSLYVFKVRAENQAGVGPATNLTAFMTPDADPPLQAASSPDSESDRKLWFVIGGGFGLAIVLLIVAIATVCLCRSGEAAGGAPERRRGRRRRRRTDRAAKEEASLIASRGGSQSAAPGLAASSFRQEFARRAGGGAADFDRRRPAPAAAPATDARPLPPNCLELRHLPQAGRGADGPVGGPFGRSSVHRRTTWAAATSASRRARLHGRAAAARSSGRRVAEPTGTL
uniref:Protein-tyrosine-phosphatase n=1 Tax=Macrostomum lignano TaxID=282301 RepID=A0A1I8FL84_9PLAT